MSAPPPTSMATQTEGVQSQSKIYKLVMTPVVFVSFLFSLAWVEFRYTLSRTHIHRDADSRSSGRASVRPSRMPPWLHSIVYRRQECQYEVRDSGEQQHQPENAVSGASGPGDFHYHSMQRKLLRMEAAEAFHIRTTVLCVLGLAMAVTAWLVMRVMLWAVSWLWLQVAGRGDGYS